MNRMRLAFLHDSGHGWLEVPDSEIARLRIADDISGYSYHRSRFAYLEEDCDYAVFARAATKAAGLAFTAQAFESLYDVLEVHVADVGDARNPRSFARFIKPKRV